MLKSIITILMILFSNILIDCAKNEQVKSTITSFNPGGQYAVITFENGPHATYTNELLDILYKKETRVTFFIKASIINNQLKSYNEINKLLLRMINEKHEIAIHGWENEDTLSYNNANITNEILVDYIRNSSNHINNNINYKPRVRRPTNTNTLTTELINKELRNLNDYIYKTLGFKTILWNIDSNDQVIKSPQTIVSNIIHKIKPGDVINFHDNLSHVPQTISLLIDELLKLGYELLTISEILSFPDDSPK